MRTEIFGKSVKGASHKRVEKECQDSIGDKKLDFCGSYVLAVADGHGSEKCPHSKKGSKAAVEVFCEVMERYCRIYSGNLESLFAVLAREGGTKVARDVDIEWKRRVLELHAGEAREVLVDETDVYRQYGSTLVGLLVTPHFIFALQVGDGDVVFLDDSGCEPVVSDGKILGVETHSLSQSNAWRKAVCATKRRDVSEGAPYAFMLSTDGFSNSFASDEEYKKSCLEYFSMIKKHGALEVEKHLETWLEETSEKGCGDDVSVLFFIASA